MSILRELTAELREPGPGMRMLVLGVGLLMAVLTLLGQVYPESETARLFVKTAVAVAMLIAFILFVIGIRSVGRSGGSNLWEMGMMGRRFLGGAEVLDRIRNAHTIVISKTWFPETDPIAEALKAALVNGATIELILCEPGSDILTSRCEGAHVDLDKADRWITKGGRIVDQLATEPGQFKGAWFHESWPGCPVIRADKRIYMGFYFRGNTSPHFPWIEIRQEESILAEYLLDQLRELKESATTFLEGRDDLRNWLKGRK